MVKVYQPQGGNEFNSLLSAMQNAQKLALAREELKQNAKLQELKMLNDQEVQRIRGAEDQKIENLRAANVKDAKMRELVMGNIQGTFDLEQLDANLEVAKTTKLFDEEYLQKTGDARRELIHDLEKQKAMFEGMEAGRGEGVAANIGLQQALGGASQAVGGFAATDVARLMEAQEGREAQTGLGYAEIANRQAIAEINAQVDRERISSSEGIAAQEIAARLKIADSGQAIELAKVTQQGELAYAGMEQENEQFYAGLEQRQVEETQRITEEAKRFGLSEQELAENIRNNTARIANEAKSILNDKNRIAIMADSNNIQRFKVENDARRMKEQSIRDDKKLEAYMNMTASQTALNGAQVEQIHEGIKSQAYEMLQKSLAGQADLDAELMRLRSSLIASDPSLQSLLKSGKPEDVAKAQAYFAAIDGGILDAKQLIARGAQANLYAVQDRYGSLDSWRMAIEANRSSGLLDTKEQKSLDAAFENYSITAKEIEDAYGSVWDKESPANKKKSMVDKAKEFFGPEGVWGSPATQGIGLGVSNPLGILGNELQRRMSE